MNIPIFSKALALLGMTAFFAFAPAHLSLASELQQPSIFASLQSHDTQSPTLEGSHETKKSLALSSQRLSLGEVIERALVRETGLLDFDLQFDRALPSPTLTGKQSSNPVVEELVYNQRSGRFNILAKVAGNQGSKTIQILGSLHEVLIVPLLSRRVGPNEIISDSDLRWERRRLSSLASNSILDGEAIIGLSPRRVLRAGHLPREGELRAPILVAKKSQVTVALTTQSMALSTLGRALEDGAVGEAIRIQNLNTNKIIVATVTGPGRVEVQPLALLAASQ